MFTIDLLKGQGVPAKANLKLLALVTGAFGILIISVVFMFGSFVNNRIALVTQKRVLKRYDGRFEGLRAALDERKVLAVRRENLNSCLTEISDTLKHETQWSDFLEVFSRHLPENVVVDRLEVRVSQNRMQVPNRTNPEKQIIVSVPARSVLVSLHCEPIYDGDCVVRDFQRELMNTETFRKNVKSVVIASREPAVVRDREVIKCQLNCVFKTHAL